MNKEEKLKKLIGLLEIEKAVEENVRIFSEAFSVELNEEDVDEIRKFLFDTMVVNLTEFLNRHLSDTEIKLLVSYFSNKELLKALVTFDRIFFHAISKTELSLNRFIQEKNLMKQARVVDKNDLN